MTDIDVGYGLDTTDYMAGIGAIEAANTRLQGSFAQTTTMAGGVSKALSMITPGKAVLGSMALLSAQAAQNQQALSGLAATATVTNVRVDTLAKGIRTMARDMPLGGTASRQLVEQFTRMGVAGEGSEKKIVRLSTAVAKLSGATGENASGLATGMVELARATGNTNLDPKRFEAIGDSLTTISAKSGASATSILQFSKSIAPMAQASGIGATGILGISSAFARLGEDGIGASTAVNKMLSDMNRSVREGSPELKTYAQFAGKSADEFERMFKSNPAEALTQVTEAIAKAGPAGPRMLEQIGVEGIRGQRSIQALVASGGLRPAIQEATAAYGSGSTNTAAEAAFGGLNDSLTQLGETTEQLAEALGAPLLKPLTTFTDALTKATGGLTELANSDAAQGIMKTGVYAGLSMLAVKSLAGPLGSLILGRQIATSGPGRAAMAGRNDALMEAGIMPGRRQLLYGEQMSRRAAEGTIGMGAFGRPRTMAYEGAYAAERERIALGRVKPDGGPSFLSRATGSLNAYGTGILSTYSNIMGQQARNSRVDPMDRRSSWGVAPTFRTAWDAAKGAASADPSIGKLAAMGKAADAFDRSVRETSKGLGGLRGAATATGSALFQTARAAGTLGKDAVQAGARGVGAIGMGGMGPMLAITAATTAIMAGRGNLADQKQQREDFMQSDISKTINSYRESIGKATDATQTYASIAEQTTKNLAASAKLGTFASAKEISDADWAAAQASTGKKVSTYSGSAKEIAAQVQAMAPNGVAPEELQAIKIDLARQMSREKASDVLSRLPASFEADAEGMGRDEMARLVGTISGAASSEENRAGGWSKFANRLTSGSGGELDKLDTAANSPEWMRTISMAVGGGLHSSTLTDASRAQIGAITEGSAQQYTSNSTKFGGKYAEQERGKNINAALKEAYDSGNADVFLELSQKAGAQMDASLKDKIWSPEAFKNAGFDFTKLVAESSDSYRSTRDQAERGGAKFTGTGGLEADLIEQSYTRDIRQRSSLLGDVFDARSKNAGAVAMSASLASPADAGKEAAAMSAVVAAADKAGKSMEDLAVEASDSARAVGESTDAYARLKAVQQRAEFEMGARMQTDGTTPGEAQMKQYSYYSRLAQQTPTTEAEKQQQQGAREQVAAIQGQMMQRLQARLQMQRQADVAEQRANEDFQRSKAYAEADYQRQRERMERNYRISSGRAQADFRRQQERAEEDFGISRVRQVRDFGIQMTRATADYLKSRERAFRDFNISLKRQIEDAAKSMYDPYSRIQTKATWDAKNLLVNLNEQTAAIEKQKTQLDALRELGLSAQSIDILGLGKAENAQQVNNLALDASPEDIAKLNAAAKARAAATGALYTDESNVDLKRQREDFNKSMADAEEDFKKSVERQRADLNRSMRDAAQDFTRAQTRARNDFRRSLERSRQDLNTTLSDMAVDRNTAMARSKKALDVQLKRMTEDIKMADQTISGSMSALAEQVDRAIHGKAVRWQKILKSDTASWVKEMKANVVPQVNSVFKSMGVTSADMAAYGAGGSVYSSQVPSAARAEGGPIPGYSPHPKADNVLIKATAGEFMQPVASVNYYGPAVMEKLRRRQIPRDQLQGLAEGGMVYKQMEAWLHKNLPGVAVTSSYRPGAVTALGNTSMHAKGKALDLAPSMTTFDKILRTFNKNIAQLFYSPADGRTILRGNPWRMDSTTKAGHWDHVHWAMESMSGMASAMGADPETLRKIFAKAPHKNGIQKALTAQAYMALAAKLTGGSGPGGSMPPFAGSEDVSRWGDEVAAVLRMLSRPMSDAGSVLRRIQFESGGNPRAINNWDSNARAGTPSKGLMQVIDPTFKAYRSRALRNDIWDPKANIYAGSNYAVKRYGSLAAIDPKNRPKGYDSGGWMEPGEGRHVNGTAKPEAVLTNEQWTDIKSIADMVSMDQLRSVNAASGSHIVVHNNQRYTYDSSNDFAGAVFQLLGIENPRQLFDQLRQIETDSRITQTRGVRRTP